MRPSLPTCRRFKARRRRRDRQAPVQGRLGSEVDSSTAQWPGGNAGTPVQHTPSASRSQANDAFDGPANQSPRIVATGIVPASGSKARPPGPRKPDEMDEFESQIQKNKHKIIPGRSLSNAAAGAKPPVQPLSREQRAAANKSADPGDSADPRSLARAHRTAPRFGPDVFAGELGWDGQKIAEREEG